MKVIKYKDIWRVKIFYEWVKVPLLDEQWNEIFELWKGKSRDEQLAIAKKLTHACLNSTTPITAVWCLKRDQKCPRKFRWWKTQDDNFDWARDLYPEE